MKIYDLCIVIEDVLDKNGNATSKGDYAIIIENLSEYIVMIELWNFERLNEVEMISIDKCKLRVANDSEMLMFQEKFEKYCKDNNQQHF